MMGFDNRQRYRSANSEANRKKLIAKVFAGARERGIEREDLYIAIKAIGKAKEIVLYKYNWKGSGEKERVSLSTLKIWQLTQLIGALFGGENRKKGKNGSDGGNVVDIEDMKKAKSGAVKKEEEIKMGNVVEFEEWKGKEKKDG